MSKNHRKRTTIRKFQPEQNNNVGSVYLDIKESSANQAKFRDERQSQRLESIGRKSEQWEVIKNVINLAEKVKKERQRRRERKEEGNEKKKRSS